MRAVGGVPPEVRAQLPQVRAGDGRNARPVLHINAAGTHPYYAVISQRDCVRVGVLSVLWYLELLRSS